MNRMRKRRGALRNAERGGGEDLDRDVVPAVRRIPLERLLLEAADVRDRPELRRARGDVRPDRRARGRAGRSGSRRRATAPTTAAARSRRRPCGRRRSGRESRRPSRRPASRRPFRRPRRRRACGAGRPRAGTRRDRSAMRAGDAAPQSREQPFVDLRADRLEHEGSVFAPVEADRGDAALRDGRLHAEVPDGREDVRVRRRGRDRERRRPADGRGAALIVERRQGERHDREDGDDGADREPPRSGLRPSPIGPQTGRVAGARGRRRHLHGP